MNHKIELKKISKIIDKQEILHQISGTFESGKIYGFVGKNGSGKTMLFRTIAGLIQPTSGKIVIDGQEYHFNDAYPVEVGIIIENAGMYKEFSGVENLRYLASLRKKVSDGEIKEVISKVGLDPEDKRPLRKYSLGMKQRIIFAQAIMEKPDVLLLDEPTNALDQSGVELIRQLILEEKKRGALICIASHNEKDIGMLCDEIYQMEFGKMKGIV